MGNSVTTGNLTLSGVNVIPPDRELHSLKASAFHGALYRQLRLTAWRESEERIYSCGMEPGENFIRRLLKFVFMVLAFIVAIVFGESYRGMGWIGALIFIIGASMGALGHVSLEGFEKLSENDVGVGLHRFCSRLAGDSVGACGVSLEKMGTNTYTRKSLGRFH